MPVISRRPRTRRAERATATTATTATTASGTNATATTANGTNATASATNASTGARVNEGRRARAHVTGDATTTTTTTTTTTHTGTNGNGLAVRLEAREQRKYTMGKDEVRAHVLVDGKLVRVPFEEALASRPAKAPGAYRAVGEADVERAWKAARKERAGMLRELSAGNLDALPRAPTVTPEDGSVRIAAYHMGFGAADHAGERFIEQMADIGRVEGFRVVARVAPDNIKYLSKLLGAEEERNVTFVASDVYHDIWSEDAGEVRKDRGVTVPTVMPEGMEAPVEILKARYERATRKKAPATTDAGKLFALLKKEAPDECFAVLGQVFAMQNQKSMVGLAVSAQTPLRVAFSAIEGGNLLVGTDKSGAVCAFVGRDSIELSRRVLAKELGRAVGDDELRAIIGKDLGLPPSQVHSIAQPADYHLDVKMLPIGPGEIVVNDALAAAERQIGWLLEDHAKREPKKPPANASEARAYEYEYDTKDWREQKTELPKTIARLREYAKHLAKGEAKAAADLEKAGMTVHRVPAVFPPIGRIAAMNFLNAEQGKGKDDQRFLIALGGDPRGERGFLADMKKAAPNAIARFYFLDRALTASTLQAGGGVNCRCKPEPA